MHFLATISSNVDVLYHKATSMFYYAWNCPT